MFLLCYFMSYINQNDIKDMKKQASTLAKLSVNKTTVARLTDFFSKDNEKSFTDSDTINTSFMCKGLTLLKW